MGKYFNNKDSLREVAAEYRDSLPRDVKSEFDEKIFNTVIRMPEYLSSKIVFVYVSFGSEIDTQNLIKYTLRYGKSVAVPCCHKVDEIMDFYLINSLNELKTGRYGIMEPNTAKKVYPEGFANSVMIVPSLAMDKNGYRVGYGKGYYDKYLTEHDCYRIGLCYSHNIVNTLHPGSYDRNTNCIVTELGVHYCHCERKY